MLQNKSQLMALVCETLKFSSVLQQVITATNLQSLEKSLTDIHLAKTLVYDAVFGKGLKGHGKLEVSPVLFLYCYLRQRGYVCLCVCLLATLRKNY